MNLNESKDQKSYKIREKVSWYHSKFYTDVNGKLYKEGKEIDQNCILIDTNIDDKYIQALRLELTSSNNWDFVNSKHYQ